jgi:hypothetical protein
MNLLVLLIGWLAFIQTAGSSDISIVHLKHCAVDDEALEPLYEKTLYRDLEHWKPGAPYSAKEGFEKLVSLGANRYDGERIVMIRNNTWCASSRS